MIEATSSIDGPPLTIKATVSGLPIYLDNDAIIEIALGDSSRREKFISLFSRGADLLFSCPNAAELTGAKGPNFLTIKDFLNEIGPHWFPVEISPTEVVKREQQGHPPANSSLAVGFMESYLTDRIRDIAQGSGEIIDLPEGFFKLGPVLDWIISYGDSLRSDLTRLDDASIGMISEYRKEFEDNPNWLEDNYPTVSFDKARPASFVYHHLIKILIRDAKSHQLKKGYGADFCHAVIASAFASVAALDKHWKHRIESLPKPNKVARIFYKPHLSEMIDEIDSLLMDKNIL